VIVADTVLEPLAAAEACLMQDERDLGCALLDIGGGSTDIVVFAGGVVRHAAAVSDLVEIISRTNLAVGLRTPVPEAERVKRENACAFRDLLTEDTPIDIASVGDRPPRTVFSKMLCDIVEPRAQEMLSLVRDELKRAGLDTQISAGLVLTGRRRKIKRIGGIGPSKCFFAGAHRRAARIAGIAGRICPARISTSVGLLLYGARARRQIAARPTSMMGKLKAMFAGQ